MRVIRVINNGGFGRVEEVRPNARTTVARKVFDPHPFFIAGAGEQKLKDRFTREVRVQSALRGPYVLPIIEANLTDNPPWFTMPLAERTLRQEIDAVRAAGTIPKKAFADVLNALEAIHDLGYVHRDLKPENVLLHEGVWKLSDFGLVRPPSGQTTTLTATDSTWGTDQYAAPEQCSDFKNAGPATDIFAFGCILHDVVVGGRRVPYAQQTASGAVGRIIEKCTEFSPTRRFQSIRALRGALFAVLSTQNFTPVAGADEWLTKLDEAEVWDVATSEEFARFLKKQETFTGVWGVLRRLDEEVLRLLFKLDADVAKTVALRYAAWAEDGSFDFEYCDVVIRRLEVIFSEGDLPVKSAAAIAASRLARRHNRWFVMRKLVALCGPSLDDTVAERIAIDLSVEDAAGDFLDCASTINLAPSDAYHPTIAARVMEELADPAE